MASTLKSSCFIVKDGSKWLLLFLKPVQPLSSRGCVESSREELVAEERGGLEEGSWGRNVL